MSFLFIRLFNFYFVFFIFWCISFILSNPNKGMCLFKTITVFSF